MSKNNEWNGQGRIGKDPTYKTGQAKNGGTWQVCMLSIACERDDEPKVKDKDGNESYYTDWINVKCWGELASQSSYFKKGDLVSVTGRLQSNSYTDSKGIKHYGYEVNAKAIEQLEEAHETSNVTGTSSYNPKKEYDSDEARKQVAEENDIDPDDLPF